MTDIALPTVGDRFRLALDAERYPHFTARKGAEGVITESNDEVVALRLDEIHEGAETWGNELHWYPSHGDDPWPYLERVPAG